ncbi:MAG: hypothetical protein RSB24_03200 [Akkermansia sp.]
MAFTETQAEELLQTAYAKNRLPHALLITGREDAGTHTLALNLTRSINGGHEQDTLETLLDEYCRIVRPRSKSRRILIDDVRAVEPFLQQKAATGKYKIVIILDAERMNDEASNAFLKTLEEPPPQCFIILVTNQPEQLLETILSRCITITLHSPGESMKLTPVQEILLPAWAAACAHIGDDLTALAFRATLLNTLAIRKNEITKRLTLALKEEAKLATQGTDASLDNKDINAAYIETEYLAERDQAIDLLITWFGQAALIATGAPLSDPLHEGILSMAKSIPISELLHRMEAVESLRDELKFNIHEGLVMDIRLMEALGNLSTLSPA